MTVHSPINRKSFLSLTHSLDNTMKHNNTNIKSISKYLHGLREQQKVAEGMSDMYMYYTPITHRWKILSQL